jgi:predicted deacetylase
VNFILRVDDICATMDWDKFGQFERMLGQYEHIKPLLGVIPENRDARLQIHPPRADFWNQVRRWRDMGWTIAQHGYTHEYTQRDGGILGIGRQSEFAGLAYEDQFAKLQAGKEILIAQDVWEPYFMAPSHSFDETTLAALSNLGFIAVTDGYGIFPYRMGELIAVPQLFSKPLHFGLGTYTICLHTNSMKEEQFSQLAQAVAGHFANFTTFPMACQAKREGMLAQGARHLTAISLKAMRALRRKRSE